MRNIEQAEIFLRHGISSQIDPSRVTAPTIVALAMDLQDFEIEQQQALKAAS